MAMTNNGLSKLTEELGELLQEVGKLLQYPEGEHPDGRGDLHVRVQAEMGDVLAAMGYVSESLGLNQQAIETAADAKLALFRKWGLEPLGRGVYTEKGG